MTAPPQKSWKSRWRRAPNARPGGGSPVGSGCSRKLCSCRRCVDLKYWSRQPENIGRYDKRSGGGDVRGDGYALTWPLPEEGEGLDAGGSLSRDELAGKAERLRAL